MLEDSLSQYLKEERDSATGELTGKRYFEIPEDIGLEMLEKLNQQNDRIDSLSKMVDVLFKNRGAKKQQAKNSYAAR